MQDRTQERALKALARIVARDDLTPDERAAALRRWREETEKPSLPYRSYAGGTRPHGVSALKAGKLRRVQPTEDERG